MSTKSVGIEKAAQDAAVPHVPPPAGSLPPGVLPRDGEFRVADVPPGGALLVGTVAVFNVGGRLCATQANCTHRGGPLNEGALDGSTVTCPYHGSQFDVCNGAVLRGPAREPVKTYRVDVEGDIGRVHEG
jgi:nitrite reductase/ring-hydroxylating ferredoxin subunit